MALPLLEPFNNTHLISPNSLFIAAEGFEARSLTWMSSLPQKKIFQKSIILTYLPKRESKLNVLLPLTETRSKSNVEVLEFNRFEPQVAETYLRKEISKWLHGIDEVILDISVMSKLMIMILVVLLKDYNFHLRIIYSEPEHYAPTQWEYERHKDQLSQCANLPSWGVHNIVRTSLLTSVVMQGAPAVLIAFTSFNEQLIRSLLPTINPSVFILINGVPPHLSWREKAMQEIHLFAIKEYALTNELDKAGRLINKTSTLFYAETFELLAETYKRYCYSNRVILAPTGSKLQAFSCALLKLCCPDVDIEYPTPESFIFKGYSSEKIRNIHQIKFDNFSSFIVSIAEQYHLNG